MDNDWIACGDAYANLKNRFETLRGLTIRKALIGMILEAGLPVVCTEFTETALAHLPSGASKSVDPEGAGCFANDSPPNGFWRYEMSVDHDAELSFSTGIFFVNRRMNAADLPYRFFKTNYLSDHIEAELWQLARGVYFSRPHLEALVVDRRWSIVWSQKAEPKAPGRVKSWQWDQVKAQFTVDVARKPALLKSGAAEIVRHLTDIFEMFHGIGNAPDKSDIYEYAHLILRKVPSDDYAPD
ncbi:MAG: hypothetical protein ACKVOS_03660 [Sphingorhabdus sp.]|uniref:hypothetical protein n=1 Tax=Sphingorhabdus sp. TaxID=1902408 RepID=UPI0038FC40F6